MKGKRSRADTTSSINSNGRRATTSPDLDEQEEEEEDDEIDESPPKKTALKSNGTAATNGAGGRSKVPMTEEEKRKNFLERNRQGNHDHGNSECNSHHTTSHSRPQVSAAQEGVARATSGQSRVSRK
jgi:ATF/CREB family transcription factor